MAQSPIKSLSAITLGTYDMARSLNFYGLLGFERKYGDADAQISSFYCGDSFLNVVRTPKSKPINWWGRVIFYVEDVDDMYQRMLDAGLETQTKPRDAEWGERYFHALDPDGHELSFAKPLNS